MHVKATQNTDFAYHDNLQNLWFCLLGQAQSRISLTLAISQIDACACQGKQNHSCVVSRQVRISLSLLARALEIICFSVFCKFLGPWFLLPGLQKNNLLLTLASSQIYVFANQGKQNHWILIVPNVTSLARASKIIDFAYPPSQIPKSMIWNVHVQVGHYLSTGTKCH